VWNGPFGSAKGKEFWTLCAPLEGFRFSELVGRATYIHRMEVIAHDVEALVIKMKFVHVMA
jgi:hypothetical protein